MVAVEMAERDEPERGRVDLRALQRNERGRTAVDEQRLGGSGEVQARLKAPAARERVARPEERQLHGLEVDRIGSRFSNQ